jgi:DNA integrity scanning protein DisA with diadenylate cyclase activity
MAHKQELKRIQSTFSQSRTSLPAPLKSKMAELMIELRMSKKTFGMFVILGWKPKWRRYADTPDVSQNIFTHRKVNIMEIKNVSQGENSIMDTINFDGAILIDEHGNILHSGAMIEGLCPRALAHKLNPHRTTDLSLQFGFKRKVHMRHITAITSSYIFKNTTAFTISEETNDFHIFENGKIIYSTIREEYSK